MRYGSVCTGAGADHLAFEPLGWEPVFHSEIAKHPRATLTAHWPKVPLHGDFRKITKRDHGTVDLLVAGTPCTDFSIAGLRRGLVGANGTLVLDAISLAAELEARWFVWENVPGVLSLHGGRAFGAILGALAERGYHVAWSVLDSQHFGVPQRRRRVILVGYLGDWRPPAAVLLEPQSLLRRVTPRPRAQEALAGTLAGGARQDGGYSLDDIPLAATLTAGDGGVDGKDDPAGRIVPVLTARPPYGDHAARHELLVAGTITAGGLSRGRPPNPGAEDGMLIAATLNAGMGKRRGGGQHAEPMVVATLDANYDHHQGTSGQDLNHGHSHLVPQAFGGNNTRGPIAVAAALQASDGPQGRQDFSTDTFVVDVQQITSAGNRSTLRPGQAPTLSGDRAPIAFNARQDPGGNDEGTPAVGGFSQDIGVQDMEERVRRLTPLECERLQGWPDNHTLVLTGKRRPKLAKDGPRYRTIGNGMERNVMAWVGGRIDVVEKIINGGKP